MRIALSLVSSTLLLLPACTDDTAGGETDGGTSTTDASSSGDPTTGEATSSDGTSSSSSSGGADGSSTGGSSSTTDSSSTTGSSSSDTGTEITCDDEPVPPETGTYEEDCAGSAAGATCTLSCANGNTPSGDAVCAEDGTWSEPECNDLFDQDGDGARRYPWGPDLDDDGDGERTYLFGGDDYDDTDPATQALSGNGAFTQGETYELGEDAGPTGVAVGDWDNDGNVDIATTNQNNNTISIFAGAGDGTFTLSQTYDVPNDDGGGRIQPADFDRDGNLDLVATFGCYVLTGAGDGTFSDSGTPVGDCQRIHVIDADDDGLLDVVTYTYGASGQLRTHLGNEDGTFTTVDTAQPNITALAPGFIDGGDVLDIAILEFENWSMSTYLGNGDGAYSVADSLNDEFFYNRLAVPRDLDGDGNTDLLVGDFINDHIALVLGDGTGQLAAAATTAIDGPSASGLFTADLDNDGSVDIVYTDQGAGFGVALGDGPATFAPPVEQDVGGNELNLAGADFNGDNRMDFVVISIGSNDMTIMLGQ